MLYRSAKRCLDVIVVLISLPIILPLIAVFGTLFSLGTGERPVYRQVRTGLGHREFLVWKLRTMTEERGENGALLPDADRLTPLGRFMRSSSIDELPQIINILKGEMSIVGPRPQVSDFLQAMTVRERKRHDVLPGLTGHAQINGRNAVTWTERFAQDLWYAENASFWLDLQIIWRTPFAILSGRNTAHEGHVTMPSLFEERSVQCEQTTADLPETHGEAA